VPEPDGHEIVIIRRNIDDGEEGHHGGVWKIAFADFMTAMMAFFLVMWLISANEKTRVTIARYFNPIKFSETTPNRKGLRDPDDVETKAAPKGSDAGDYRGQTPPPDQKQVDQKQAPDAKLSPPDTDTDTAAANQNGPLKGPNSVPSQVFGEVAVQQDPSPAPAQATASAVRKETNIGDSFRDPFAPSAQEIAVQPTLSPPPAPQPSASPPLPSSSVVNTTGQSNFSNEPSPESTHPVMQPIDKQVNQTSRQSAMLAGQAEASNLRADISNALKDDLTSQPGPGIEVRATDEGTLISLMDEPGFEMFAVGSARPQARVVEMMEKVAQILEAHAGSVIIRGHTDGRVYKSATYDNWRLSADRADTARDMLINGGLDEKRIQRIEGFADRQLKKPEDPDAAENRRIEILLKDDKP
jgi:chemotaxis protein MotB